MLDTEILSDRLIQVQSLHDRCIDSMTEAQASLNEYESQEIESLYQSVQQLNDRKQAVIADIAKINTQFYSDVVKALALVCGVLLMGIIITGGWADDSSTIVVISIITLVFAIYKNREKQAGLKEKTKSYDQMISHQMSEISFLGILTSLVEDILKTSNQMASLDQKRSTKGLDKKRLEQYRHLSITKELQFFQLALMTLQKAIPNLAAISQTENFNQLITQSFYSQKPRMI